MSPQPRAGVALVVLTGGAGTRMGRDKAGMQVGGMPLAARPVAALEPLVDEVVLAGRAVEGVAGRVVADAAPGRGPLAGVVAGLAAVRRPLAVVVACDAPHVAPALVALLLDTLRARPALDAAVCASAAPDRLEPLPMAVRPAAAERLRGAATESASLQRALHLLATAVVPETAWRAVDARGASFVSWNRPEDVEEL